ncbi:DUF445 family protein [Clostridium akagii]|uniref:DUF445 family protein n=1 Tax=Clostridium akagii TaxID=91623 RepID=UPI00047C6B2E|nr:DUF445 family protein [Clostridium akagii]
MKRTNRRMANIILLIFAIVFLFSYAFKDNFIGGLISGCSAAALIGGLADWFGITAIFKKPMNINWPSVIFRTNIINRNRDRIIDTMVDAVENDLLNKDKLKAKFASYKLSVVLIIFLKSKIGDKLLDKVIDEFTSMALVEKEKIGTLSYEVILGVLHEINLNDFLYEGLQWTLVNGYQDKAIDKIIPVILKNVQSEDSFNLVQKIYHDSMKSYEKNSTGRKLVNKFLLGNVLGISSDKAAKIIQDKLIILLNHMLIKDDKNRIAIKNIMNQYIKKLKYDQVLINKIQDFKNKWLLENHGLKESIKDITVNYIENNVNRPYELFKNLKFEKRKILYNLLREEEKMQKMDETIKELIFKAIDEKHGEIGKLVKKNLDKYNNDEITNLLKEKVEDDLQIIRINGSVVGGVVGIITYLLTFWIR